MVFTPFFIVFAVSVQSIRRSNVKNVRNCSYTDGKALLVHCRKNYACFKTNILIKDTFQIKNNEHLDWRVSNVHSYLVIFAAYQ